MPRIGGVYGPPSGTKGVSGSTIQSVPYNTFVDDLTADANAARPVTAGGTGATTASGARSNLGTDNADNLLSGTVADARLPANMSGKTFTSTISINGANNGVELGSPTVNTPFLDFHSSGNGGNDYDSRIIASGGGTSVGQGTINIIAASLTLNGNVIWSSANDGSGSGLDADLLDGQQGSFYLNAANLTGTINDARLPGTMSAKTISDSIYIKSAGNRHVWYTNAAGVNRAVAYHDNGAEAWSVNLYDSSGNFVRALTTRQDGAFLWSGNTVWHSGNDGGGSGLDADLLDGQDASYFTNIIARLGFTPVQQGGGPNQGTNSVRIGWGTDATIRLQVDATDFGNTWPMNITGNAGSAGSANNASNLGGVPASSYAQYSQSANQSETAFPLGQVLMVQITGTSGGRRELKTVYLSTDVTRYTLSTGASTALAGTWRQIGALGTDWANYQRVA
ncbi:hypothetical protein ACQZ4Z_13060 [Agrobacterium vitis]|uniref:hypothetical protein n=1 Tax=Agrobacterium vitis TaxID=373 RepID=UPI001F44465C|nr:hypothetical protein [Agrobacterium vitis]